MKTIKCKFCGRQMEAEEILKDYHICPPKEIYEVCPICKKENICYKIGKMVYCERAN